MLDRGASGAIVLQAGTTRRGSLPSAGLAAYVTADMSSWSSRRRPRVPRQLGSHAVAEPRRRRLYSWEGTSMTFPSPAFGTAPTVSWPSRWNRRGRPHLGPPAHLIAARYSLPVDASRTRYSSDGRGSSLSSCRRRTGHAPTASASAVDDTWQFDENLAASIIYEADAHDPGGGPRRGFRADFRSLLIGESRLTMLAACRMDMDGHARSPQPAWAFSSSDALAAHWPTTSAAGVAVEPMSAPPNVNRARTWLRGQDSHQRGSPA